MIAHTSYSRSVPMTEAEARSIAAKTHLFGYSPMVVPYQGAWHLSLCSKGDHDTLAKELDRVRG